MGKEFYLKPLAPFYAEYDYHDIVLDVMNRSTMKDVVLVGLIRADPLGLKLEHERTDQATLGSVEGWQQIYHLQQVQERNQMFIHPMGENIWNDLPPNATSPR
jgi:hypothetical protein